jgi:hypothetical protein
MLDDDLQDRDDELLEKLLGSFQPVPSQKFYRRFQTSPWIDASRRNRAEWMTFSGLLRYPRRNMVAALAFLIILGISSLLFVPDLRGVAQNLLHYLQPAQSDRIAVPVKIPYPDDAESFGTPQYFSLSLAQAEEMAGFKLKEIYFPIRDLKIGGAHYDPDLDRVVTLYTIDDGTLYFSQRRIGNTQEYSQIGASAPVEIVRVHELDGEYVSGGWRVNPESALLLSTSAPGKQVDLSAVWDSQLPQQILRWREGDFLLEILAVGDRSLGKEGLLLIAESVK